MYSLKINEADVRAIEFSGYRYGWSDTLQKLGYVQPGEFQIPEHEAWEILDSLRDNGLDFSVPLLSEDSNLFAELLRLEQEVV